ncbi:hypothetical protein [Streptomyces sp. URMC 123]|uniref:hypothetical protein n=1 Tax=Streptomyces sp. URMC 123 TaxID=3423403 RepID=UPI003F1AEB2F
MNRSLTPVEQIAALRRLQSRLTCVLVVVALVALVFTATNVTLFAIDHHVSPWIAWLLDPMVALALGAGLIADGRLSEHGVHPSGWASALRWFAGVGTWLMNCWSALWPAGAPFGVPRQVDPAALVLHSVPPVLLILLAEAISHYRRAILARIGDLQHEVDAADARVDARVERVEDAGFPPASARGLTAPAALAPRAAGSAGVGRLSLVICGGSRVHTPLVPPSSSSSAPRGERVVKLPAEEAARIIRACWVEGATIPDAARRSTRSTSYVHKVYKQLEDEGVARRPRLVAVPDGQRQGAGVMS